MPNKDDSYITKADLGSVIQRVKIENDDKEVRIANPDDLAKPLIEEEKKKSLKELEKTIEQKAIFQDLADSLTILNDSILKGGANGGGTDKKGAGGILGAIGAGLGAGIGGVLGTAVGGLIKGIGGGFKYLGKHFKKIMAGAVAMGAIGLSLIPAAKAFQMFSDVSWDGVKIGLTVLAGLGVTAAALSFVAGNIIVGAAAIAILGLAMLPAAKAFQMFGEVTWDGVIIGLTVLGGLAVLAAALSFASPLILVGAAAIGILALAMLPAAKAFQMFGAALNEHIIPAFQKFQPIINGFIDRLINSFGMLSQIVQIFIGGTIDVLVAAFESATSSIGGLIQTISAEIQELAALDGAALLLVAGGITAIGLSLAAFGATGAVGSVLGAIGNFFTSDESPISKLKELAKIGPALGQAAKGIGALEKIPRVLKRIGEALKSGFKTEISALQKFSVAISDLLKDIDKGLDKIDFKKLDKVTGLIIHHEDSDGRRNVIRKTPSSMGKDYSMAKPGGNRGGSFLNANSQTNNNVSNNVSYNIQGRTDLASTALNFATT